VKNLPVGATAELTLYSGLRMKLDVSFGQNNENPQEMIQHLKALKKRYIWLVISESWSDDLATCFDRWPVSPRVKLT
jgi:hypothetical protein